MFVVKYDSAFCGRTNNAAEGFHSKFDKHTNKSNFSFIYTQ
jgi:hypothetical protein